MFKLQPELSISNKEMEAFLLKFSTKITKITSTQYKYPSSKGRIFEECLKNLSYKTKTRNKKTYFIGDLN